MEDVLMMAKDMDEKEKEEFLAMAEQIDSEEDVRLVTSCRKIN